MASNASSAAVPKNVQSVPRRHGAHDSAHDDGTSPDYGAAERRITELSQENALLAEKATAASLRFIDYENELRVLRETVRNQQQQLQRPASASSSKSDEQPPIATVIAQSEKPSLSRLGTFIRKASGVPPAPPESSPDARRSELQASLAREQTARVAAETKVKEVNAEIEELSASLFQQANDMVASERRENAELRERIKLLEQNNGTPDEALKKENARLQRKIQALEQRETDRKRRLERLEAAQKRIDRVRLTLASR